MLNYKVSFQEKNKPTGKRSFQARNFDNYESILFGPVLDDLCLRKYQVEYWYQMLNEHIFVKRQKANTFLCVYEVQFNDMYDRSKKIADFEIEIECLMDLSKAPQDIIQELLSQNEEVNIEPIQRSIGKQKNTTKWLKAETMATRQFIYKLHELGSLDAVRKEFSKATYYRNLKKCKDLGYIKEGKLVRKVLV